MERFSESTLYFLASIVCGLLTDMVVGDKCRKAVLREKWTPAQSSHRGTWDKTYFECDDGCCGDPNNQYCCPDDDNDDNDDDDVSSSSGMLVGFSVSIVILIILGVVIVLSCVCHRARQKRSQQRGSGIGRGRHNTVSTTLSSATLPPSYELTMTLGGSPSNAFSPPSYEEVIAGTVPSAPPLPASPRDSVATPVTSDLAQGKDNQAFSL